VKNRIKDQGLLAGRDGCDVLLLAIPIARYLLPPLHLMLGLGNNLAEQFFMYIDTDLDDSQKQQ
jgi:hypothetical protein